MSALPDLAQIDDATLAAVIAEASIPTLMNTLVHLTGDPAIIRGGIKVSPNVFADNHGGISPEDQQHIRDQALPLIKAFRDGGGVPASLDEDVIREMIQFMTGMQMQPEYVDFLKSELSLDDGPAFEQPALEAISPDRLKDFSVIVIGAGMSGILTAIKLKEAGIAYTVIEKNPDVGGTWFQNTYPGCRVDSPNHTYSYSFAPRDWPNYYSPQPVLLEYFQSVAKDHDIRGDIQFNTEVERAEYDSEEKRWRVTVHRDDGSTELLTANAVVSAVGQLNRPPYPEINGIGSFEGPAFHSGEWEHEHDLTGKRVIVIGTGASAFQFTPIVAEQADSVTIFQRTPPWVAPRAEYHDEIPEGEHWLLSHLLFYDVWFRFFQFWRTSEGVLASATRDEAWNESGSISQANHMLRELLTENARRIVGDEDALFSKVVPGYPPAGKRMLVDNGTWYRSLLRDNVEVVTDPITKITKTGVVTESGREFEGDVLIYGTGFQASNFMSPMQIVGRDGVEIHERWNGEPRAYMGMAYPYYPNFFSIYGPNTNLVVNGSIIFFSECQGRYILGCIAPGLTDDHRSIEPTLEAFEAHNERIDQGNLQMAWGAPHVRSWYKNASGRVTQNWPFSLREFWELTQAPDPQHFVIE